MLSTSLLGVYVFAFVVSIGAVISPGPVSAAIISESPRQGWRVGPLIASGHVFLELLFIILITSSLSTYLASNAIQIAIALGGSLLLFFMGGRYIWSSWKGSIRLPSQSQGRTGNKIGNLIGAGILTTISNPFWYAWWATIVPGYLNEVRILGIASVAAFYLGHISADFLWDTLLSTAMALGKRWISRKAYVLLLLSTGSFMIYLGVVFMMEGVQKIGG